MSSDRVKIVEMGITSDTNSFTSAPTLIDVDVYQDLTASDGQEHLSTDYARGDGLHAASEAGSKIPSLSLSFPVKGVSGGAGDDTSPDSANNCDAIRHVFEACLGVAAVDYEGETTHASDAGTGAAVILDATPSAADGGTAITYGAGLLVEGTTSGRLDARFVESDGTSSTLTLNAALLDATPAGGADTPNESTVVYGSATWALNSSLVHHKHLWVDVEYEYSRRQFKGWMPNLTLDMSTGQHVKCMLSGEANDWSDDAEEDPTYSQATAGSRIVHINSDLVIEGTRYLATNLGFDLGMSIGKRETTFGTNGYHGFLVSEIAPKITFDALFGSTSVTTGVLNDATLANWRANNTYDLVLQVGRTAGAAMAIWFPAARLEVADAPVLVNGQRARRVTAHATAPSTTGITSECYISLF